MIGIGELFVWEIKYSIHPNSGYCKKEGVRIGCDHMRFSNLKGHPSQAVL